MSSADLILLPAAKGQSITFECQVGVSGDGVSARKCWEFYDPGGAESGLPLSLPPIVREPLNTTTQNIMIFELSWTHQFTIFTISWTQHTHNTSSNELVFHKISIDFFKVLGLQLPGGVFQQFHCLPGPRWLWFYGVRSDLGTLPKYWYVWYRNIWNDTNAPSPKPSHSTWKLAFPTTNLYHPGKFTFWTQQWRFGSDDFPLQMADFHVLC